MVMLLVMITVLIILRLTVFCDNLRRLRCVSSSMNLAYKNSWKTIHGRKAYEPGRYQSA